MIHIIVNPAAGKGKAAKAAYEMHNVFEALNIPYKINGTKYEAHAKEIAEACVKDAATAAVCCIGGDGTVHEVVGALADTGIPLGLVPLGSGNDFAASLGRKKGIGPKELARAFAKGGVEHIDLIACDTKDGRRFCANVASIGVDAAIVDNALKHRKNLGKFAYLAVTPATIMRHKNLKLTLDADGTVMDGDFVLCAVCNGSTYGGGFKVAPGADMKDGRLTLCIVDGMNRAAMSALFPALFFGVHHKIKTVRFMDCESLHIQCGGAFMLNIDGNIYNSDDWVRFTVLPKALAVLTV